MAAGIRDVPIPKVLRSLLAAHRLRRVGDGFVSARRSRHGTRRAPSCRARLRWGKVEAFKPLADFGPHEARPKFASPMIDAGVNGKASTEYMGPAYPD